MPMLVPDRLLRCGKRWIGKRTKGHRNHVGLSFRPPVNCRPALRAESEGDAVTAIRRALVTDSAAIYSHILRPEKRCYAEGASGSTLARQAMTDRNQLRIAYAGHLKLTACTGSLSIGHFVPFPFPMELDAPKLPGRLDSNNIRTDSTTCKIRSWSGIQAAVSDGNVRS